ncbi:T9SS type A sorting domain-containing protein [Hymenobacter terricola]|uniref:T9SS type A sorting domain-containing protein n=1 Tax=Hymenobacter terricola TaxID=2819236 RepID=UPI001B318629|nr:T9SS type A sorting domain-containing protein [Hymenobacter terricola]
MRAFTRIALALVAGTGLAASAQGQALPNLNLETWTQRTTAVGTGVEAPQNWQTTDDLYGDFFGSLPNSTTTVSKTTDAHGGTYAALLTNKLYTLQGASATLPGIMALGSQINFSSDGAEITGVPYTSRPTQIQFYYKLTGAAAASDSAAIFFSLTHNVAGSTQEVAFRGVLLPPVATYTLVTLPITYSSAAAPDSVHLTFLSSNTSHPTVGTQLFVDDVTIGTVTATRNAELQAAVSVAPNPSTDGRFTLNTTQPALLAAPFTVTDATGRVVLQGPKASPAALREVALGDQAAGLYTLQLHTEQGTVVQKLVVK